MLTIFSYATHVAALVNLAIVTHFNHFIQVCAPAHTHANTQLIELTLGFPSAENLSLMRSF